MGEQDKQDFLALEGLDHWSDFTGPWAGARHRTGCPGHAFALFGAPASACAPGGPGPQYLERFRLITGREPVACCAQMAVEPTTQDPTAVL